MAALIAVATLFTTVCSRAAEISVTRIDGMDFSFVSLTGEIVEGDGAKFVDAIGNLGRATVVLQSPGGLVKEALQIGAEIRLRNLATMVAADGECFSACGLIWVSGARRYMSAASQIGFHAAYREENGEYKESGVANAEIGSFLTHLGLRIEAIRFFTVAGPTDFLLLTPDRARALGIDVFEQNGSDVTTPAQAPSVDIYVDRFVSYAFLKSRCNAFFKPDQTEIDRGIRDAFERGNAIVGSEQWIKLWTQLLDNVKMQADSKGALLLCLETEASLREQGQPTGISGPSYQCTKAATSTETAMCTDHALWSKDRAMNEIYFWIRNSVEPVTRKRILTVQRSWLSERNSCGGNSQCLNAVYDRRFQELKSVDIRP